MILQIQKLEAVCFISVEPETKGGQVRLKFSELPPEEPGVYVIYLSDKGNKRKLTPFYIGETRNLLRRLKMLFRCNSLNNPHPCQTNFATAVGKKINKISTEEFCNRCKIRFISTAKMIGRIEIEEALQNKYGTNCDAFYRMHADAAA